jgi:hypothetical protein
VTGDPRQLVAGAGRDGFDVPGPRRGARGAPGRRRRGPAGGRGRAGERCTRAGLRSGARGRPDAGGRAGCSAAARGARARSASRSTTSRPGRVRPVSKKLRCRVDRPVSRARVSCLRRRRRLAQTAAMRLPPRASH